MSTLFRIISLLLLFHMLCPALVKAQGQSELTFAVNSPGSPPYAYFDQAKQGYQGIVVDFFNALAEQGVVRVNFVDSNRTRSEQYVIEGKMDLFIASSRWLDNPRKTILSAPLLSHKMYLFSTRPFTADFQLSNVQQAHICTRRGFVYPGLEPFFQRGNLIRMDSSTQVTMAAMFSNQRCEYVVMNDYSAAVAFNDAGMCNLNVYRSPQPTSEDELVFVMRPALYPFKQQLDQHIAQFKAGQQLELAFSRHAPELRFPKLANCQTTAGSVAASVNN